MAYVINDDCISCGACAAGCPLTTKKAKSTTTAPKPAQKAASIFATRLASFTFVSNTASSPLYGFNSRHQLFLLLKNKKFLEAW